MDMMTGSIHRAKTMYKKKNVLECDNWEDMEVYDHYSMCVGGALLQCIMHDHTGPAMSGTTRGKGRGVAAVQAVECR